MIIKLRISLFRTWYNHHKCWSKHTEQMMAEPKARTLIQQLGFFDTDIRSGSHDEIMIWLQENAHPVVNRLFYKTWSESYLDNLVEKTKQELAEVIPELEKRMSYQRLAEDHHQLLQELKEWDGLKDRPVRGPVEVHRLEWEKAIEQTGYNSRKFTIGFIDMAIEYSYPDIRISGIPRNPNNRLDITCYELPQWKIENSWSTVYVEVKPKWPRLVNL